MSELPNDLYFNPHAMRNRLYDHAWPIYVRTRTLPGDAHYVKAQAHIDDAVFFEMRDAMQELVDRCEDGEVLSKYTYAKFIEILERAG